MGSANTAIKSPVSAIVTGAASGIGYQFALLLARDNYELILIDIDEANLKEAKENIRKECNTQIRLIVEDLGKPGAAQNVFDQVSEENVEVLINNAGFGLSGYFTDTDWKAEESMIYLHVLTTTQLTKLILKGMVERKSGKIMNISSVAAFTPGPLMAIYYASKGFMLSFGNALSEELKGSGVTVTTVCPGLTRTKFSETRATLSNVKVPKFGILADSSEKVARIAYKAMCRGKALSVPVFKNRLMAFLTWLVPRRLSVKLIRKMQSNITYE